MTMTMAPPTPAAAPPAAPAAPLDPAMEKSLNTTMQGLASLYMACHKADPDSPLCDAIMQVQKAVAEIGRTAGSPQDPAMMAEGQDPMAPPPGEDPMAGAEGGMPPEGDPAAMMGGEPPMEEGAMPPGSSIADAAGATQTMMQDAAKRRMLQ